MASVWISPLTAPELAPRAVPSSRPVPRRHRVPVARPREAPARDPLPWHFYRRRAAAAGVLGVALLAGWQAVSAVGHLVVQSPATQFGSTPDVAVIEHNAEPGETLWSIAVELGPSDDVRRSVDELTRLNGGSALVEGRPVRVPRAWYASAAR